MMTRGRIAIVVPHKCSRQLLRPLAFEGNGFLVSDMEIVVGVDGQGETNPSPALMVDSLSQTTFSNLRVIRRGSYINGTKALTVRGSTDRTVRFESSDFINEVSRGSPSAEFDAEAVYVGDTASPIFNSSIISPIKHPYTWSYDAADNGRFRPWAGKPWQLVALQVYVVVTHPGVTVSLGTVPGGDDIASQVPLDSPEAMPMAFRRAEIDPDAYIYATASVPVNNGDFAVQYAVIANYAGSPEIWLRTKGYALFERSTVIANGASNAVEIGQDSVDTKNWKIASSHLETLDPVNQYSVSSAAPLSDAPILLSVFVGGFRNISSLAGE